MSGYIAIAGLGVLVAFAAAAGVCADVSGAASAIGVLVAVAVGAGEASRSGMIGMMPLSRSYT